MDRFSIAARQINAIRYVSPAFNLSTMYFWSRDVDEAGVPLMINFGSGSLEANKFPKMPDIAAALCVRSN